MKLHVRADWRGPSCRVDVTRAHEVDCPVRKQPPYSLGRGQQVVVENTRRTSRLRPGRPEMQLSYTENAAHEGLGLYIVKTMLPLVRIVQKRSREVSSLLWLRRLHIPFHERRRLHLRALVHGARGAWPISIACRTPHHCSSSPTTDGSEHVLVLEGKRELKWLLRTFVDHFLPELALEL